MQIKTFQLKPIQIILIIISIIYLSLVLFIPLISLCYKAFHQGFEPFFQVIQSSAFLQSVKLTVIITLIAVPLNTFFGLCASWVIARNQFKGKTLLMSIIDLPFSVSPVVAGLMIVLLYGRLGWFGSTLEALNFKVIFALPGMVMATIFVTLPFVAREVIPVLEEIGKQEEEAALTLGANDWQIFWKITLPNIRWGLLYGVLLTNARAMGEFGAVSVVSGSIIGKTSTLPIFVEQTYQNYQTEAAFGSAFVLLLLGFVSLICKEILERKIS